MAKMAVLNNLTLTSVVFEYINLTVSFNSIINLTLTSVVFEFRY